MAEASVCRRRNLSPLHKFRRLETSTNSKNRKNVSNLNFDNVFPGQKRQNSSIFFGFICFQQLFVSRILFFFSRFEIYCPTFFWYTFCSFISKLIFPSERLSTLERSIVTFDCLHLWRRRHWKWWTLHLNSFLRVNGTSRSAGSIWIVFSRNILPFWESLFPLTFFLRAASDFSCRSFCSTLKLFWDDVSSFKMIKGF